MLALQILIDGFAISALYGLGAIGFTLMFGVSGVLNLAHGGIMLIAALRHPLGPPLAQHDDPKVLSEPVTDWVATNASA